MKTPPRAELMMKPIAVCSYTSSLKKICAALLRNATEKRGRERGHYHSFMAFEISVLS